MIERKARSQFPRSRELPTQSSQYWVKEKDRYLRQLLISDIEEETGRELIVYYSRLDQQISEHDADDISEILQDVAGDCVDLMLHTPGGDVDAVEKFVTVIHYLKPDYRVFVPGWAKSGGTLIALASRKILLGVNSELGPVDPQINLPPYGFVPADYASKAGDIDEVYKLIAQGTFERAKRLTTKYLKEGMLKAADKSRIQSTLKKLSSANGYGSHGAVIDYDEAVSLGLSVQWMEPDSELWKRIWLLKCLYHADTLAGDIGKIFEGATYSISRPPD